MSGSTDVLFVVYIRTVYMIKSFLSKKFQHVQNQSYKEGSWRYEYL